MSQFEFNTQGMPHKSKEEIDHENAITASLNKIKNTILVMSGKGGVGKSSVSVNLALALAKKDLKVGLMDIDIHGPDIPRMLGKKDMLNTNNSQKLIPLEYSKNLKFISMESLMPNKDEAIIWRGPMKHSVIKQFIGDVEWGNLDYLIIDAPPGTGDEPLSIAQTIKHAKAIIVTTPQEISLADVRKSINFCKTIHLEIAGVIENMSDSACPHCGKEIKIFGAGGGEKMAQSSSIRFLGRIPFDSNLVTCGDTGTSYIENYPDSPVSQAFYGITDSIVGLDG
jgi:ATP-binding protein involved in chromosome partitioning